MRLIYIVLLLFMLGSCGDKTNRVDENIKVDDVKESTLSDDTPTPPTLEGMSHQIKNESVSIKDYANSRYYKSSNYRIVMFESGKYGVKLRNNSYADKDGDGDSWSGMEYVLKYCVVNNEHEAIKLHWKLIKADAATTVAKTF